MFPGTGSGGGYSLAVCYGTAEVKDRERKLYRDRKHEKADAPTMEKREEMFRTLYITMYLKDYKKSPYWHHCSNCWAVYFSTDGSQ